MANVLGELFQNIADAIRSKTGSTDTLKPNQFPAAIEGITTGGGSSGDNRVKYVTFVYEENGETKEHSYPVIEGDTCRDPVANGFISTPTKESTAQYNYTFYGWGASDGGAADANILKNITEDKTVYAIFTATVRYYTITWLDDDGTTVLKTESLAYGTVPSYKPSKDGYLFKGWAETVVAVTGNASYTAQWAEVIGGTCGDSANWMYDATSGTLTIYGTGRTNGYYSKGTQPWYSYVDGITKVVVEDGITQLNNGMCWGLTNMTEFSCHESCMIYGGNVFRECTSLESVRITSATTVIQDGVFYGCTALQEVTIPSSVLKFCPECFKNCSSLTSAIFEDTATLWKKTNGMGTIYATNISVEDASEAATTLRYIYANQYLERQ